jgi:hypothetical protein
MLVTKHSKNLILSFFWQQWIWTLKSGKSYMKEI